MRALRNRSTNLMAISLTWILISTLITIAGPVERVGAEPADSSGNAGLGFVPLNEPCLVLDSRNLGDPLTGGSQTTVPVTVPNVCELPEDAAGALFNIAAIDSIREGNLVLTPEAPVTTTGGVVNFGSNGLSNSNTVPVGISNAGTVTVTVNAGPAGLDLPTTHFRLLVLGAYAEDEAALGFISAPTPCAIADTRLNQGATQPFVGPHPTGTELVAAIARPVPLSQGADGDACRVPSHGRAVMLSVSAVNTTGTGTVSVASPSVSDPLPVLAFAEIGMSNSVATVVPLDESGDVVVRLSGDASATAEVRLTVLGWFGAVGARIQLVPACPVFDSRESVGAEGELAGLRAGDEVATYAVTGSSISGSQGGHGAVATFDCGVPTTATAVHLNQVAVNAERDGNLRLSPSGVPFESGTALFADLVPKMNNSNAVPVGLDNDGRLDVGVNAGPLGLGEPTVHVRGVVFGFYESPLECEGLPVTIVIDEDKSSIEPEADDPMLFRGGDTNDVVLIRRNGVQFDAAGGDDTVCVDDEVPSGLPVVFFGGEGSDTFRSTGPVGSIAYGGPGEDTLQSGSGRDILDGGDGANDVLDAGEGEDLCQAGEVLTNCDDTAITAEPDGGAVFWSPPDNTVGLTDAGGSRTLFVAALGDSYTAGNGSGRHTYGDQAPVNYRNEPNNGCYRSLNNYANQYAEFIDNGSLNPIVLTVACSGDVTGDVYDQVDAIANSNFDDDIDLVTMTIGGNDLGFAALVASCDVPNTGLTGQVNDFLGAFPYTRAVATGITLGTAGACAWLLDELPAYIDSTVNSTRSVLNHAAAELDGSRIVLLGYPYLFGDCNLSHSGVNYGSRIRELQRSFTDKQAAMVASLAQEQPGRFVYVDMLRSGGGICSDLDTIVEPSLSIVNGWYHPNGLGHFAMAARLVGEDVVAGLPLPDATQPPQEPPVVSNPPPQPEWTEIGDLYRSGVTYCSSTYGGHPSVPGHGPALDLNAVNGDLGREVIAPADGYVTTYTTGYGGGWGNSILFDTLDGTLQFHVAHLNEIRTTGRVTAGEVIGLAGNSGYVYGVGSDRAAHMHVSMRVNGLPAAFAINGSVWTVGSCRRSTGPIDSGSQPIPPPLDSRIAVAEGRSAQGERGCSSASCKYLQVSFSGLPGSLHQVSCHSDQFGQFFAFTTTANSVEGCYYGFPGDRVWAVVDGLRSPSITWSSAPGPTEPTDPPPDPAAGQVVVSVGAPVSVDGCTSSYCRRVRVDLSGLAGGDRRVRCVSGRFGEFYDYAATGDITEVCTYGYPGDDVWVLVDGIRSNTIAWLDGSSPTNPSPPSDPISVTLNKTTCETTNCGASSPIVISSCSGLTRQGTVRYRISVGGVDVNSYGGDYRYDSSAAVPTEGCPSFVYWWDPGMATGRYDVRITDTATGRSVDRHFEVVAPPPAPLAASLNKTSCVTTSCGSSAPISLTNCSGFTPGGTVQYRITRNGTDVNNLGGSYGYTPTVTAPGSGCPYFRYWWDPGMATGRYDVRITDTATGRRVDRSFTFTSPPAESYINIPVLTPAQGLAQGFVTVRSSATSNSTSYGTIASAQNVRVVCWTTGQTLANNSVWYRIQAGWGPGAGTDATRWVTDGAMATQNFQTPDPRVPRC